MVTGPSVAFAVAEGMGAVVAAAASVGFTGAAVALGAAVAAAVGAWVAVAVTGAQAAITAPPVTSVDRRIKSRLESSWSTFFLLVYWEL